MNFFDIPDVRSRARQLIKLGQVKSADWLLKRAIAVSPGEEVLTDDLAELSLERAKKMIAAGYLECALIRLREALFLNPDLAEARDLLNEVLLKLGRNPHDPDERLKMAGELVAQNRYIAAIVEYRESLALRPSVAGYLGLADMYARSQQPDLMRAALAEAQQLDPHNALLQRKIANLGAASNPVGANQALTSTSSAGLPVSSNEVQRTQSGRILTSLWNSNSIPNYTEFSKVSAPAIARKQSSPSNRNAAAVGGPAVSRPNSPAQSSSKAAAGGSTASTKPPPNAAPGARPHSSAQSSGRTQATQAPVPVPSSHLNDGFDLPTWYSPANTSAPSQSPTTGSQTGLNASFQAGSNATSQAGFNTTQQAGFNTPGYPSTASRTSNVTYGGHDALSPAERQRAGQGAMGPEFSSPVRSGPKADPRVVPTGSSDAMLLDPEVLRQQIERQKVAARSQAAPAGASAPHVGSDGGLDSISKLMAPGAVEDCACDPADP